MASSKLFGCAINVEIGEDGGCGDGGLYISGEYSQSYIQPDGDAMSLSDHRENGDYNPDFHPPESDLDPLFACIDAGSECFVDFFDRESFQVESPNTSGDIDFWRFDDTYEEEIGIGSGSGQVGGNLVLEVNRNREIDPVPVPGPGPGQGPGQVEVPLAESMESDDNVMDLDYGDYIREVRYNDFFGEEDVGIMGSSPASKRVIDNLPIVKFSSEELRKENIVCAICKDEVVIEEKVKKLPCKHYYHGDCINSWLRIRNTCPICRFELPTDDLDYYGMNRRSSQRPDTT